MSLSKTWDPKTEFKAACKSIIQDLDKEKFELVSDDRTGILIGKKELHPPQEGGSERCTVKAFMAYKGDDTQPKGPRVVSFDQKNREKALEDIEKWPLEKVNKPIDGQGVTFRIPVFAEDIMLRFIYNGPEQY